MSLTAEQLLTVMEALRDKAMASDSEIGYFIPTPNNYGSKAGFWNDNDPDVAANQELMETTLISALWIDVLRFEDTDPNIHAPVKTLYFEFTVFHEDGAERLNEADDFEKRILLQRFGHTADVFALVAEFQGGDELDLDPEIFAVSEYQSLIQTENVARDTECSFISGVFGSQTKLICPVRIQTVAC